MLSYDDTRWFGYYLADYKEIKAAKNTWAIMAEFLDENFDEKSLVAKQDNVRLERSSDRLLFFGRLIRSKGRVTWSGAGERYVDRSGN